MKQLAIFFSAACAFVFASCANRNNATNVQDMTKQFINAWNNRDTSKIDSLLASDVQFLQADAHFSGKNDVRNKWVLMSLPGVSNLKTNAAISEVDDHTAYEGGTFSVDVSGPNQPPAIGEGNYFFLWKKQADGSWKISYIQLEDLPLQVTRK